MNPRVVITPRLPLPPYWGSIILDVQGRPPLAEGWRGFPLERRFTIVSFLGHSPSWPQVGPNTSLILTNYEFCQKIFPYSTFEKLIVLYGIQFFGELK